MKHVEIRKKSKNERKRNEVTPNRKMLILDVLAYLWKKFRWSKYFEWRKVKNNQKMTKNG